MNNIYAQRRNKLGELLLDDSIVLLSSGKQKHLSYDEFFPFEVNRNFYYLTGVEEKNATLMVMKSNNEIVSYLFIQETTPFMRRWVGEMVGVEEASATSGIISNNVIYIDQFHSYFQSLMTYGRGGGATPSTLYLDLFRSDKYAEPVAYETFKDLVTQYPELTVKDANEHISYLRMFKSEEEIAQIQEAINLTDVGLKRVMKNLYNRTNEGQLAADFLHEITLHGSNGLSFHTIAATGVNATVLHYDKNNTALKREDLILFDLGARNGVYGADITRTYPLSGKFTKRQRELYQIVLNANKACIDYVKPGITWKELNNFARDVLAKEALAIQLIKEVDEIDQYYFHTIGHGLGLDIHDVGHYALPLEEGMVLTIEPGLYLKEEGIGIRIEDNIVVTKTGAMNLSSKIIKEIDEIEEYLQKL